MLIRTTAPDPSWEVALRNRDTTLWVGPSFIAHGTPIASLDTLVSKAWRAVYLDIATSPLHVTTAVPDLVVRQLTEDPGADLPPNRLPLYFLRGKEGTVAPNSVEQPSALLARYSMLSRAPLVAETFVIGIASDSDLAGLIEASRIAAPFRRLIVVSPSDLDLQSLVASTDNIVQWQCDLDSFLSYFTAIVSGGEPPLGLRVLCKGNKGTLTVDISNCVDPSFPVTSSFQLISADDVLSTYASGPSELRAFLNDPTKDWHAYATGMPYPRHIQYERAMLRLLKRFSHEGPSLTCTAWISAQDGSGATTTLRHVCFNLAREGYPVLLAKPHTHAFDFMQLSTFIARATETIAKSDANAAENPWVIAFDAEHSQLNSEFLCGLANGLKNHLRQSVVIAVRTSESLSDGTALRALGTNKLLGDTLQTTVSVEEGVEIGQHLSRYLPLGHRLTDDQWRAFVGDTIRTTGSGARSLFWVSLRFWLSRLPGADASLRKWLSTKLQQVVSNSPTTYAVVLEIAVLAKHRLSCPTVLLGEEGTVLVHTLGSDPFNALGIQLFRANDSQHITFAHPLIAEEVLRIAQGDDNALSAINMSTCLSALDFELHLLARLIRRPSAGTAPCQSVMEELVTSALRVDPREAPRNYQARAQIVQMLEAAPAELWDRSQLFNHHVAKARRHLASDPPDASWTFAQRLEQLVLAERHIDDALYNIVPASDKHVESKLNLFVSLALTLDARARLEEANNDAEAADRSRRRSEDAYTAAQRLDGDNTYVLENYARFKLRRARFLPLGEERTRLILEAVMLLELERELDDIGLRDLQTMEELAGAYHMLEEDGGVSHLGKLAALGSEAAFVALAKLYLRNASSDTASALDEAEDVLRRVNPTTATWRTHVTLYYVISRKRPYDFAGRLELLDDLAAQPEFVWPLQLKLEYAILLFQAGNARTRQKGAELYRQLRDEMSSRSGALIVPDELRFLRDPSSGFHERLATFVVVKRVEFIGRNSFAVPDGWGTQEIVFRPLRFGRDDIRPKQELDCFIQFTNFGPQAVPRTMEHTQ